LFYQGFCNDSLENFLLTSIQVDSVFLSCKVLDLLNNLAKRDIGKRNRKNTIESKMLGTIKLRITVSLNHNHSIFFEANAEVMNKHAKEKINNFCIFLYNNFIIKILTSKKLS
jgi:hypothetical protein